jgi:hypothetical protein
MGVGKWIEKDKGETMNPKTYCYQFLQKNGTARRAAKSRD